MGRNLGKATGNTNFATVEKAIANGVTVTDGDFVRLVTGDRISNATIGTGALLGTVNGADTTNLQLRTPRSTATGDSGGTVKAIVEIASDNRYELTVNGTLAADAVGSFYNLTGATGAQVVDNATKGTSGQLLCIEANGTKGVFTVSQAIVTA